MGQDKNTSDIPQLSTPVTELLGIKYPIFQGGMAWIADASLASAVSNAGGLGLIACGVLTVDKIREQIRACKEMTDKPFGLNIMLMSRYIDDIMQLVLDEDIKVITTGAGNPGKYIKRLKENDVKAVFFITGQFAKTSEDLIKRMIDEGQIIGNHTSKHRVMPDSTEEQIKEDVMSLHQEIYEKFGYEMKYIRPPKGEYSEKSIAYTNSLGYKTIMWSFAYDDWDVNKQGRQEYGKKKILDNLHNGEIMLLHATSKDNSEILDEIIKEAKRQGYEFRSIDEFER